MCFVKITLAPTTTENNCGMMHLYGLTDSIYFISVVHLGSSIHSL